LEEVIKLQQPYLVLTSIINWIIQVAYVVDTESHDKVNYAVYSDALQQTQLQSYKLGAELKDWVFYLPIQILTTRLLTTET
jgi:hypothetical protein